MAERDPWIWDGGRACLDFANTLRERWGEPRETLREPQDLRLWLHRARLLGTDLSVGVPADSVLHTARLLRAAMDRAVLTAAEGGVPDSADLAVLNGTAAAAPRRAPRLVIAHGRLLDAGESAAADPVSALGLLAHDAADLLLAPEIRQVRVCEARRCALRFLDRSPARNRRWCSMARCGNRTKVRRHQTRAQEGS